MQDADIEGLVRIVLELVQFVPPAWLATLVAWWLYLMLFHAAAHGTLWFVCWFDALDGRDDWPWAQRAFRGSLFFATVVVTLSKALSLRKPFVNGRDYWREQTRKPYAEDALGEQP